tara:strand:+ start:452 stop:634 length:183 start_codon:yes stop_codon:yes gene_type:complete
MNDIIKNTSWKIAAAMVVLGLLHKFAGVGIEFVHSSSATFFHVANTALLFGIFFSLQKGD